MGGQDLVLDAAVRDWVLLPLTLSVVLMMVLRQYMSKVRMHVPQPSPANCHSLTDLRALSATTCRFR